MDRFVGPFGIIERIGPSAYHLDLPPAMAIHNVFHTSLLKRFVPDDRTVPLPVAQPIKVDG